MDESYRQQEFEGRIYTTVEETFLAGRRAGVWAGGLERPILQAMHWRSFGSDALTNVQLRFKVLIGLSTALGTAGILWIGARQAMAGEITVGAILPFSFVPWGALHTDRVGHMHFIHDPGRGGKRPASVEIEDIEPDVRDKPGAPALARARSITIENVTVGYELNRPVFSRTVVGYRPR